MRCNQNNDPYDFSLSQVVTFQERLSKLEQEREHWMLESQLLQMKYEKEQQVWRLTMYNSLSPGG